MVTFFFKNSIGACCSIEKEVWLGIVNKHRSNSRNDFCKVTRNN